jgi:hypothetical protein
MELTQLSKEDLLIVSTMLINGKSIEEVEAKFLPQSTRTVIDNLHSLICTKRHHGTEDCLYYEEKEYDEKYRKEWLALVNKTKDKFQVSDETLTNAIAAIWKIEAIIDQVDEKEGVGLLIRNLLLLMCQRIILKAHNPVD